MDFDKLPANALGEYICQVPGIKVLVVDGNLTRLASVSKMLRTLGYSVVTASLAYEALFIIEEKKNELHLVLIEVHLPDMRINVFAEKIREISHLPYSLMTADDYLFSITRALRIGAKLYFKNPIITCNPHDLWKSENRRITGEDVEGFGWHTSKVTIGTREQSLQSAKRKEQEHDTRGAQVESLLSKSKRVSYDLQMLLRGVELAGVSSPPNQKQQLMSVPELLTGSISNFLQRHHQSLKQEANPIQQHSNIQSSVLNLGSQHQCQINHDEGKWPLFKEQPGVTHNPPSQGCRQIYVCNCKYLESRSLSIFPHLEISHGETSTLGGNQLDVPWELQGIANNTSGSGEITANGKAYNGDAFINCVNDPSEQKEMDFLTTLANDMCQRFPPSGQLPPVILPPLDEEHGNFGAEAGKLDEIFYSTRRTQQFSDEDLKILLSSLPRINQ